MTIVVVPAYNEQNSIGQVVKNLREFVDQVVVVNDGSTDETAALARAAGALVITHLVNRGYGAALATGTDYALDTSANYILHFDADGQFVPSDIPRLVEPLIEGKVQVALGSRFLGQAIDLPVLRRLILKVATVFTWAFSGLKLTDAQNGFRAFTTEAASAINIHQDGKAATSEIIDEVARLKLKYVEVPVTVYYTHYSLHKPKANSVWDVWRIVRDLFVGKIIK